MNSWGVLILCLVGAASVSASPNSALRADLDEWVYNRGNEIPCQSPFQGGVIGFNKVMVGRVRNEGNVYPMSVEVNSDNKIIKHVYTDGQFVRDATDFEILCKTGRPVAWQPRTSYDNVPQNSIAIGETAEGEKLFLCRDLVNGPQSYVALGWIDSSLKCKYVDNKDQVHSGPKSEEVFIQFT